MDRVAKGDIATTYYIHENDTVEDTLSNDLRGKFCCLYCLPDFNCLTGSSSNL